MSLSLWKNLSRCQNTMRVAQCFVTQFGQHSLPNFKGTMTIALKFALGFDGKVAQIGDIVIRVNERTISHATGLPIHGERWFKN
jgi:hypothetical protein